MNIGKTLNKIERLCDKNFSKIPLKERKDSINMHVLGNCCDQYYYLIDNDYYNFLKRLHICNALNDLKYETFFSCIGCSNTFVCICSASSRCR